METDKKILPTHIAIIMDGNGRWAQKRFLSRIKGHEKGADTVRMVVRTCREVGIPFLTLYAFSTENWQRPKKEVAALMSLLKKFLSSEHKEMMKHEIRLNAIGRLNQLPSDVQKALEKTMHATENNRGLVINLALNYGARAEIVEMVQKISRKIEKKELDAGHIDEKTVEMHLYTSGVPDPDLLIRTSGEMRISNFLLWQIAYSEIFVTDTLWPDFTKEEFLSIIDSFQKRSRRFGKV
jgi:undecaprenyl diphosphate synthase